MDISRIFFPTTFGDDIGKKRDSDGVFLAFYSEIDRAYPRKLYGFGEIGFVRIIHGFLMAAKTPWSEKYHPKDGTIPSWTPSTLVPNTLVQYTRKTNYTRQQNSTPHVRWVPSQEDTIPRPVARAAKPDEAAELNHHVASIDS